MRMELESNNGTKLKADHEPTSRKKVFVLDEHSLFIPLYLIIYILYHKSDKIKTMYFIDSVFNLETQLGNITSFEIP